jgi:hypothetical protein
MIFKKVYKFFDRLEDRVRRRLSQYPILYTIIGGSGIVLFWRGVWITADEISLAIPPNLMWLNGPISVAVSIFILLITGLFVSFFLTDRIILSGLRQEKKLEEKTESEVRAEGNILVDLKTQVDRLEQEIKEIDNKII